MPTISLQTITPCDGLQRILALAWAGVCEFVCVRCRCCETVAVKPSVVGHEICDGPA